MVASGNKTIPTSVSPALFVNSVEIRQRREDGLFLLNFFKRITGMPAKMWGTSIVGFGRYHYKYESGREGEHLITGFSPRKSALSVYIMPGYQNMSAELARLGKHKIGKSCLYINKLSDVDMDVLEVIVCMGVDYIKANYQTWEY